MPIDFPIDLDSANPDLFIGSVPAQPAASILQAIIIELDNDNTPVPLILSAGEGLKISRHTGALPAPVAGETVLASGTVPAGAPTRRWVVTLSLLIREETL